MLRLESETANELDIHGEVLPAGVADALRDAGVDEVPGCEVTCERYKIALDDVLKVRRQLYQAEKRSTELEAENAVLNDKIDDLTLQLSLYSTSKVETIITAGNTTSIPLDSDGNWSQFYKYPTATARLNRIVELEAQLTKDNAELESVNSYLDNYSVPDGDTPSWRAYIADACVRESNTFAKEQQVRIAELEAQLKEANQALVRGARKRDKLQDELEAMKDDFGSADELAHLCRNNEIAAQARITAMRAKVAEAEANIYIDDGLEAILRHADEALDAIRDAGAPKPGEEGKQ